MTMESPKHAIPIVDLGDLKLGGPKTPREEEWQRVACQLTKAFEDIGFVYLRDHGLPQETIDQTQEKAAKFFALPEDTKSLFKRGGSNHGYVATDRERLDPRNKHEIRESFNFMELQGPCPDKEVPGFRASVTSFVESCLELSCNLLRAMALGLGLDREFFVRTHSEAFRGENCTTLRLLHYPPIPSHVTEGTLRCGAHADYGSITLLFQDHMGGLQVKNREGVWEDATPIPGTILINAGELLQYWTSERFVGTVHRVVIPKEEVKQKTSRRSMAFFMHPDDHVIVAPLNGSSDIEPISARQFLDRRFQETYVY
ncbi:uncharacterized protein LOC143040960 [Oratosquilla oratoria]|uniref:uncharacterized protein LOC143040960 n=1 Tax=Oratosquilla oratoria TaxID=337810 RepID=UPI003F7719F3